MIDERFNSDELLFEEGLNEGNKDDNRYAKSIKNYRTSLLNYAKNKKSLIFLILHIVPMLIAWVSIGLILSADITLYQGLDTQTYNWIKPIMIIPIVIVGIIPFGLSIIYLGGIKNDTRKILLGLDIMKTYLKIVLFLIIIGAIFSGLGFALLIIAGGVVYFFIGVMVALMVWFNYKYISKQISFIEECRWVMVVKDLSDMRRPHPMNLSNYIMIWLGITIISFLLNGFSFEVDFPFKYVSTINTFRLVNILVFISSILQIIKLSFALYLVFDLDQYLIKTPITNKNSNDL